jgi:hypothetical protein
MVLNRHRKVDFDSRFNLAGRGLLPDSELNSNITLKQVFSSACLLCLVIGMLLICWSLLYHFISQNLLTKVKDQEEEIAQLKRHLTDYSVKVTMHTNNLLSLSLPFLHFFMFDDPCFFVGSTDTQRETCLGKTHCIYAYGKYLILWSINYSLGLRESISQHFFWFRCLTNSNRNWLMLHRKLCPIDKTLLKKTSIWHMHYR